MTTENQTTIDNMTKDVLKAIKLELAMIKELDNGLTFSFNGDAEAAKEKSIREYERKLERNLKVLKVLKG